MGKSSSLKKKRSKKSSQLRMRKRNKVKGKKSKSKKLRHQQDDSVSYSDDSDSTSTASISSSSSEDDYKSRRSQSRNRKHMKGKKKRARRRSSGRESSENSPCIKKRGGSRKRTSKRKKSTRDVIMSSRSSCSRSLSCSTCPSDSDESGYEKRKGRSERREKYGRSEKVKGGSKRTKGRSRSCSSCSRYNEESDHSIEERVMEESNTRRLKSVITVVKRENESSRELIADEPKEDVYDYDDYPSCRSNDSNDGCNRRELQYPHAVSETKRPPDDEQVEVSNVRTSSIKEINVSNATDGLNGDDIELILRQRALENLKKFRGGLQKNINPPITPNDNSAADVKTLSSVNTDSFQITAPKADDGRMVITSQVSQQIRQSPVRRDSSALPKNDRNTPHMSDGKYSETVGSDLAPPLARVVSTSVPTNKPKLVMSQTGLEAPNTHTTRKQEAATQEPCQAKLVTDSNVDEGGLETTQTLKPSEENAASVSNRLKSVKLRAGQEPPDTYSTQKQDSAALESSQGKSVTESSMNDSSSQSVNPHECGNLGSKVNDTCDKPTSSGNISSDKQEDETKDGSQFQQKTMSVMRGGEMVQVSYQVYIPKRAPALARRQLKR